jgi:hypothetical protein
VADDPGWPAIAGRLENARGDPIDRRDITDVELADGRHVAIECGFTDR